MKYLTEGKYVVTGLVLLLLFFVGALVAHIRSGVKTSNNRVVGEIKFKTRKILRKLDQEVVWEEVEVLTKIKNRDTIRTDEGSEAILVLMDGDVKTEIRLDEKSMILIEDPYKINFVTGSISASSSGGTKQIEIASGDTKISLDQSDVKISKDETQALNLQVDHGKAKISSESGEQTLTDNQAAELKGNSVQVKSLSLDLISPEDQTSFPSEDSLAAVNFQWKPSQGVKSYRLEIASDPKFKNNLKSVSTQSTETGTRLNSGFYYWRVTAANPVTGKQEYSPIRSLRLSAWTPPRILSPSPKESFDYTNEFPSIRFQWKQAELPASYTLEVANDPGFKAILYTAKSGTGFAKWEPSSEGTFYSRIKMSSERQGFPELQSAAILFSVRKLEQIEPPKLLKPLDQEEYAFKIFKANGSFFSWSSRKEYKNYQLQISEEPNFQNIVAKFDTASNFLRPNFEWKEGTYYWRVKANLAEESSNLSNVQSFRLKPLDNLKLSYPSDGLQFGHPSDGKISFRWERPDPSGVYHLQVSKESSFADSLVDQKLKSGSFSANLESPGEYFWRVRLIASNEEVLLSSPSYKFVTSDDTPFLTPVYPRDNDKVDLNSKDALSFYWETQGEVDSYALELLEFHNKHWKQVFKKEVKKESFDFRDLYQLKDGKYQWNISAKYKDKAGKSHLTIPIRKEFTIILSSTLRAPEILTPREIYVD
ncbi:transcriptional regulator [Leptospira perolatii]|uniref:Transcriptional regulator n=1 Tax=Leptospira perolatii TaxID=2023191 RepID=A0A2M9ZQN5_9LEPT|nr:FecR domain-containing protein [Leptospira perolatii]PJZ70546.1 transcriptional regulator [Leptospira perolatii]PJZ74382.1 transcriptional regulator [Leptospira perolatii]